MFGVLRGGTVSVSVKKTTKEGKNGKGGSVTNSVVEAGANGGKIKSPIKSMRFGVNTFADLQTSYSREGGSQSPVEFVFEVKKGKKLISHGNGNASGNQNIGTNNGSANNPSEDENNIDNEQDGNIDNTDNVKTNSKPKTSKVR